MTANFQELAQALPLLLPLASKWVEEQESLILARGRELTVPEQADARKVGVRSSEKIRLLLVPSIPTPEHPLLADAAATAMLITEATGGLTLRYGIYIRQDEATNRSLHIHEFAHVEQYERLGIRGFLESYLRECVTPPGYPGGPMEQEAVRKAAEVVSG